MQVQILSLSIDLRSVRQKPPVNGRGNSFLHRRHMNRWNIPPPRCLFFQEDTTVTVAVNLTPCNCIHPDIGVDTPYGRSAVELGCSGCGAYEAKPTGVQHFKLIIWNPDTEHARVFLRHHETNKVWFGSRVPIGQVLFAAGETVNDFCAESAIPQGWIFHGTSDEFHEDGQPERFTLSYSKEGVHLDWVNVKRVNIEEVLRVAGHEVVVEVVQMEAFSFEEDTEIYVAPSREELLAFLVGVRKLTVGVDVNLEDLEPASLDTRLKLDSGEWITVMDYVMQFEITKPLQVSTGHN